MRICLVTDYLPGFHREWSGSEQVCLRLSQLLEENGQATTFLTTSLDEKPAPGNVYQIPAPQSRIELWRKSFPIDILSLGYSFLALKRIRPDIVHLHCHILFLPALISAKMLNIPVIMTVLDHWNVCPNGILKRGDDVVCTSFHGAQCAGCLQQRLFLPLWMKRLIARFRAVVFDYFLRRLDGVVALTKTSAALLEKYGLPSEKIHILYHYQLDLEKERSPSPFEGPTILFVGSLLRYKGLHILIEAMSLVVKEIPGARLMVVGSGDSRYKAEIEDMIGNLGLDGHISFLGKRRNEEVMKLLARSDVVVVPEQWPSCFGPVILIEAMGLGRPILASNIGSIPEFIEDGVSGFLVQHDQPEEFAARIIWLLQHRESAQAMGAEAKKGVSFLYDKDLGEEAIALYQAIIEAKKQKGVTSK